MSEDVLKGITPEQKEAIRKQLAEEDKAAELQKIQQKKSYEDLRERLVEENFLKLSYIASNLKSVKAEIFADFAALVDLKKEMYKITEDQGSHTFTSASGKSIVIGHNVIDRWDETVSVGVTMVKEWIGKKATDDNSVVLVGFITDLLKPNKDGVLKANRVLDLQNKADELQDAELQEAVKIIRQAYRPMKTTTYVKAKFRNEDGQDVWLALSMSAAE